MSCRGKILLVGDSILDNYYWLDNKEQDLRKELIDLGFLAFNYASEDSTVKAITLGVTPKDIYRNSRSYPYPIDNEGKMFPIKLIEQQKKPFTPVYGAIKPLSFSNNDQGNMIVLSIGGNSFQTNPSRILLGTDYFFNAVVNEDFISDYENLVKNLKKLSNKVVLISIYLPFFGKSSSYGVFSRFATPIMTRWRSFLQNIAQKYNIPILDLSRTFNTDKREHYGTSDIEPSNISNTCMAKCLSYIYENYDGYHTYYAPDCDFERITVV